MARRKIISGEGLILVLSAYNTKPKGEVQDGKRSVVAIGEIRRYPVDLFTPGNGYGFQRCSEYLFVRQPVVRYPHA